MDFRDSIKFSGITSNALGAIEEGLQDIKNGKAIRKYSEGSVSLGKAAETAGLPKRLFMYKLQKMGIPLNIPENDFMKSMDVITRARKLRKSS